MPTQWEEITGLLREHAQSMHEAREAGLAVCRKITQTSSRSIRHVHRHQFDEARELLKQVTELSKTAREHLSKFGELFYAGYLHDAEKEMVEAAAVLAIVHGEPYPTPKELGVLLATYLNGMAEAASEVRRFALDEMRKGRTSEAERILGMMEEIYDELITFDFPDSMTGGLRRSCDALRAVIERTRSDLTATSIQIELIEELKKSNK